MTDIGKDVRKAAVAAGRPWRLRISLLNGGLVADDDRYVTITNMQLGAYALANTVPGDGRAHKVTITHADDGLQDDPLGTVAIVGTAFDGSAVSETLAVVGGGVATSVSKYATITSLTGAGWVTNGNADDIKIGFAAAVAGDLALTGANLEDKIVDVIILQPDSGNAAGLDDATDEATIIKDGLNLTTTDPTGKQVLAVWYDVRP